jgi:hypothetical protein
MYLWIKFLHVVTAFAFVMAHGFQVYIMFKIRAEQDPEKNLMLFDISPSVTLLRILLSATSLFGLVDGFMFGWWKQGWFWASVVLIVLISVAMIRYGTGYYTLVFAAANRAVEQKQKRLDTSEALAQFRAARMSNHLLWSSVTGFGGLLIILWLMMFKPF